MNREELKEKICEISNSEFPLIDFFNDIGWLEGSKWFNIEKAYEDIEKIYNVFMFYINKCNKLEKELKQTKLNFKNSQIHSKNCYKKLKEKYEKLERAYKNNEVMVRDLNELINRNLELRKQIENLEEENQGVKDDNTRLWHSLEYGNNEISKLKKAIKILKGFVSITKGRNEETLKWDIPVIYSLGLNKKISQEQYELLEQVFESVGEE